MEYERSIFRVYERTVPTKFFMNFSIFCSSFFTAMFLVSTLLFIIANTTLTDGGGIIKNQWQLYLKNQEKLSSKFLKNPTTPDQAPALPPSGLSSKKDIIKKLTEMSKTDHLDIYAVNRTSTYMRGDIVNIHFLD